MAVFVVRFTWDGASLPPSEQAVLSLTPGPQIWTLSVEAPWHGDPPPEVAPGPTPGLWNHEVVELFLVGADDRYLEIELGPHGHHLVLQLHGVRRPIASGLPLSYRTRREGHRWHGVAQIPASWIPTGGLRANAFAIHGQGPDRRYLCATPVPGPEPDFHRLHLFPALPTR